MLYCLNEWQSHMVISKRKKKHLTNSIEDKDKILNQIRREKEFLSQYKTIWKTNKKLELMSYLMSYSPMAIFQQNKGHWFHQLYWCCTKGSSQCKEAKREKKKTKETPIERKKIKLVIYKWYGFMSTSVRED